MRLKLLIDQPLFLFQYAVYCERYMNCDMRVFSLSLLLSYLYLSVALYVFSILTYATLTKTATNVSLLIYFNSLEETPTIQKTENIIIRTYMLWMNSAAYSYFSCSLGKTYHFKETNELKKQNTTTEQSFHSCVSNVLTQY